jgi:hypothetical protein
MTHDHFLPALPERQAPTAAPAGSQSEGSSKEDPHLRLLITSIVLQELNLRDSRIRSDLPRRSKSFKGRGQRGSGSEVKRQQAWAKEKVRRQLQRQEQVLDASRQPAVRFHQGRSQSRGFLSWRRAAAESSKKAAAMAVAAEHRSAGTPRKESCDRLASVHHHLSWWRASRAVRAPFSPWPDPNAPSFVPPAASAQGPLTRMGAAAARAAPAAPAEVEAVSGSAPVGDAKNSSDERWHSWMADYERTEQPAICEGCGKTSRLWICECGARLCSGHCIGLCSNCGGELPWESTDSDSYTLSEEYDY